MKMKNLNVSVLFLLIWCGAIEAQNCDPNTPVFTVDMTGQPNGTWISPAQARQGYCCGITSGSDECIQFNLTLDTAASAISFDIYSGAMPGGSMFFQINCGPPQPVGQAICLNGPGPYVITFCKPGNNANQYAITSLSDPGLGGTRYVSQSCIGSMVATGLEQNSIQWTSVPPNATYNNYLSCTSGCDSVTITPSPGFAGGYIDYQVCGDVAGNCDTIPFCDTIRVYFVNYLSVAITPVNPTICYGGTNVTVTATGSGGLAPYHFIWSTGDTTSSITVGPGTYYVNVTDQMNCSIASDSVTVNALPSPISCNAGTDGTLCLNNAAFLLSGSVVVATGGLWSCGGSFVPSATTLNAEYYPSSTEITNGYADLRLITTGNFNCPSDTDYVHLAISYNPSPQINGPPQVCIYGNAHYSTNYVSGHTYQWSVAGGTFTGQSNNAIDVQWTSTGSNIVTVIETNSNGCDSTYTLTVNVLPKPAPRITGAITVCNAGTENYSVQNYTPGNNYIWSVTNGILIDTTSVPITVQWTTPGNGNITVKEINPNGCDSVIITPVTVVAQPVPVISGPTVVCNLSKIMYTTPYSAGNQYNWTVTNGFISLQGNGFIEVQWTTTGVGTITLSEINPTFCDSTTTLNVTILPQPVPVIAGPQTACSRSVISYNVGGTTNTDQIYWTISGGTIQNSTTTSAVNVVWTTAGQGELNAHVINQSGCDSMVIYQVTILEGAEPEMEGPIRSCIHDTCMYSVSLVQGHIYYWQVLGGTMVLTNGNSIAVSWQTVGTGTVIVTEATPAGCDSTISMSVTVDPVPLTNATGSPLVCQNESATFLTSATPGNQYAWTAQGAIIAGGSNQSSINCTWPLPGNYDISLIETNSFGCKTQSALAVQVAPKPVVTMSGNSHGCLNARSYIQIAQSQGVSYQYSVTNGIITNQTGGNLEILWISNGVHTLSVDAVNMQTGCQAQNSMDVTIDPLPVPVIDANSFSGCSPLSIAFTDNADSSQYNYTWNFGDGALSFNANPQHVFTGSGQFPIKVIVTNASGCRDSAMSGVSVYPSPSSSFIPSLEKIYAEYQEVTFDNNSQGAIDYNWNFGNGDSSSSFAPSKLYNAPGKYTVTLDVTNSYGCRSSSHKFIEVIVPENIFVPNAFTPDGDTKNDYFSVAFHNITEAHTSIYNRWGELIYETDDMEFRWDGRCNGSKIQNEVYVYVIDATGVYGTKIKRIGHITVLK